MCGSKGLLEMPEKRFRRITAAQTRAVKSLVNVELSPRLRVRQLLKRQLARKETAELGLIRSALGLEGQLRNAPPIEVGCATHRSRQAPPT